MIRTQIQLTPEQAHALKQIAAREGKSMAELIRLSVDQYIRSGRLRDEAEVQQKALAAIGKFSGPPDLAARHDQYLAEAFDS